MTFDRQALGLAQVLHCRQRLTDVVGCVLVRLPALHISISPCRPSASLLEAEAWLLLRCVPLALAAHCASSDTWKPCCFMKAGGVSWKKCVHVSLSCLCMTVHNAVIDQGRCDQCLHYSHSCPTQMQKRDGQHCQGSYGSPISCCACLLA